MRAPYGLKITDPFTRWDDLFAYLDVMQPRACVAVGSAGLVSALCDRYPDMITIARRFGSEDNNAHRKWATGELWVAAMRDWLGGERRPWLYWNNEPTYEGVEEDEYVQLADDRLLIRRTHEVFEAAYLAGYKVIGPNWSVGWPRDDNLENFTAIYEDSVTFGHMIGLHIYGGLRLYDPTTIDWFLSRADVIAGLQPDVQIGITEFGLDVISQIPGSGPWRGIGMSERDYALEHISFYENALLERPYVHFLTTFCWGSLGGQWAAYDVRDAREWQSLMIAHQWTAQIEDEEPMPTLPDGFIAAAVSSTSTSGTRVRKGPGLTEVVGLLTNIPVVGGYDPVGIVADGWTWGHIWTPEISGWCARQYLKLDTGGQGEDTAELHRQLEAMTTERDVLREWKHSVQALVCEEYIR